VEQICGKGNFFVMVTQAKILTMAIISTIQHLTAKINTIIINIQNLIPLSLTACDCANTYWVYDKHEATYNANQYERT